MPYVPYITTHCQHVSHDHSKAYRKGYIKILGYENISSKANSMENEESSMKFLKKYFDISCHINTPLLKLCD
jgi:hypothetical protein